MDLEVKWSGRGTAGRLLSLVEEGRGWAAAWVGLHNQEEEEEDDDDDNLRLPIRSMSTRGLLIIVIGCCLMQQSTFLWQ